MTSPINEKRKDLEVECAPPAVYQKREPSPLKKLSQQLLETYGNISYKKYGIGNTLKKKNGSPCQGSFKTVASTNLSNCVAVLAPLTNPHKSEFSFLARIQDIPHVPRQLDYFPTRDKLISIQENVGPDLHVMIYSRIEFDLFHIERIAKSLLESLTLLHDKSWIHGDIKPANVSMHGNLLDFGLAREIDPTQTIDAVLYTRYYRPPELIWKSQPSFSADMWALGALLFEIATKTPLIPVAGLEDELQADINMIHAYQERMKILFEVPDLEAVYPGLIEKREDQLLLKPSTLFSLIPYQNAIAESTDPKLAHFRDLLSQMLQINPTARITAKQALGHPFFESDISLKILPLNQPLHLRIVHKGKVIKTMDLAKPDPCLHIWHSSQPYELEYFDPADPETVLYRFPSENRTRKKCNH
jgi:negative regulator of PHO system